LDNVALLLVNKKDVRKNNRKMHTILKQFIEKQIKLQAWQI